MATLHPFTLIACALGLPALGWILPAPWAPLGAGLLGLALCGWGGRGAGPGVLRAAALTAAPFWIFLYMLHGVDGMVGPALRLTAMIAAFLWLVAVLPPPRLVEALIAARWPVSAAFLLSATLAAVPALRARAGRIVDAQRCRGLATRGGPLVRLAALRALALPLVLSAIHEVDERALALETRGLSPGVRRTPLAPPRDRAFERVVRWAILGACLAALAWRL
jgi:energy-coupling factor transporter transmembrane protein EcfT